MSNQFQSLYDCNLCDGEPVFANEREWSLHNAVLHYKPATSFAGRKRKPEQNNDDDDNESGNDDDDDSNGGEDSNSSQKRMKKLIWEKVENRATTAGHTSANSVGPPPTLDDAQSPQEEQEQPQTSDGQRPSTSSPVPDASSPELSLALSHSPLSQPGTEQLTEEGEIGELSAAGLSQADLEASEREELRMEQERLDREMAERMQTEEENLESDRMLAEALQERENEEADESDPGEGPSGGRRKAVSTAQSLNVKNCQNHVETAKTTNEEPKVSSNDEMNENAKDVDMADAPEENDAQETAMDSEPGTSMDHETNPEGAGRSEPEQGSSKNRRPGPRQNNARKSDVKYPSSMLPHKLFRCNQCEPPRYFLALDSKDVIDHMMETNHINVDEVPPLSELKKFHFRDPWRDT